MGRMLRSSVRLQKPRQGIGKGEWPTELNPPTQAELVVLDGDWSDQAMGGGPAGKPLGAKPDAARLQGHAEVISGLDLQQGPGKAAIFSWPLKVRSRTASKKSQPSP